MFFHIFLQRIDREISTFKFGKNVDNIFYFMDSPTCTCNILFS